jgi:SAM-dependent methyltransferase
MTDETFDRDFWEQRWTQVRSDHPDALTGRPPNPHVLADLADLPPGRALDAGCGHGAETIWLAARGWHVTAVDFSATALDIARSTAVSVGAEFAERIEWVEGDLGTWTPPEATFDLVLSVYVHVDGSVPEMVRRLGSGVAPGGSLFLVGHLPVDPATGKPTPAAGQVQVSVDAAQGGLKTADWDVVLAEERPRTATGSGVDAVVRAIRRPHDRDQ